MPDAVDSPITVIASAIRARSDGQFSDRNWTDGGSKKNVREHLAPEWRLPPKQLNRYAFASSKSSVSRQYLFQSTFPE
jgi:hypothetical protein